MFWYKTSIAREVLASTPVLKYIGVLTTGYDKVGIEAAREKRIAVPNIPGFGTKAVSQYAVGLMLEACLRTGNRSQRAEEGHWRRQPGVCFWYYPLREPVTLWTRSGRFPVSSPSAAILMSQLT
ncbi:MAG: hypothetical protein LBP22_00305 [Deltaproteobacteria bacterium]|jgi:glycerate dehydrogenase|nr:hypothetical protein [Deltaproteobacteria bacterium]